MSLNAVRIVHADDTGEITADDVQSLLDVIHSLSEILFTRAVTLDNLIYQLSLPLVMIAKQPRSGRATLLIGDFFLLSLRDFLSKYLSVLADLPPNDKQCLFRIKSRLSCALHFNCDLTEVKLAEERRSCNDEASLVDKPALSMFEETRLSAAPPIDLVCSRRVSFVREERDSLGLPSSTIDTTRVLTIESFCPSFTLYTVANLNPRLVKSFDVKRFTPTDLANDDEDTDKAPAPNHRLAPLSRRRDRSERDEQEADGPYPAKKRPREKSRCRAGDEPPHPVFRDTRLFLPPDAKSWYTFCQGHPERRLNHAFWPRQVVPQHSQDILNDRAIRELLDRLTDDSSELSTRFVDNSRRGKQHEPLSTAVNPPRIALPSQSRHNHYVKTQGNDEAYLFVERHEYTNDVASYLDQQRRRYRINGSDVSSSALSDIKYHYLGLLDQFSLNWAKLHFMEPRIFSQGGSTES